MKPSVTEVFLPRLSRSLRDGSLSDRMGEPRTVTNPIRKSKHARGVLRGIMNNNHGQSPALNEFFFVLENDGGHQATD